MLVETLRDDFHHGLQNEQVTGDAYHMLENVIHRRITLIGVAALDSLAHRAQNNEANDDGIEPLPLSCSDNPAPEVLFIMKKFEGLGIINEELAVDLENTNILLNRSLKPQL